jgi:hypothetical protein
VEESTLAGYSDEGRIQAFRPSGDPTGERHFYVPELRRLCWARGMGLLPERRG